MRELEEAVELCAHPARGLEASDLGLVAVEGGLRAQALVVPQRDHLLPSEIRARVSVEELFEKCFRVRGT